MTGDNYLVQEADLEIPGERVPQTTNNNHVDHLIDGDAYFGAMLQQINKLLTDKTSGVGGGFFYMHSWWLQLIAMDPLWTITLDDPHTVWKEGETLTTALTEAILFEAFFLNKDKTISLKDKLIELAEADIDVRVLGWCNPLSLKTRTLDPLINMATIASIEELRKSPKLVNKVCQDFLGHSRGAMHLKFVISGNNNHSRGLVAGLDCCPRRFDLRFDSGATHTLTGWHDAGVKTDGSVNQTIYNFFRDIWNELVNRPPVVFMFNGRYAASHVINRETRGNETSFDVAKSVIPGFITPLVEEKVLHFSTDGPYKIQVLRTIPKISAGLNAGATVGQSLTDGFRSFSFAPDGIYEFRAAVKKAISQATKYIYIEDQGFCSWEIFQWINQRIKEQPLLTVILLQGSDPQDESNQLLLNHSNTCLIKDLSPAQIDRIYIYGRGMTVHSKIIIIDDEWASIGSANSFQRSFYTDGELSVSIINGTAGILTGFSFARLLRMDLMRECCESGSALAPVSGSAFDPFDFGNPLYDIDQWLEIWKQTHGSIRLLDLIRSRRASLPTSSDIPAVNIYENSFTDVDLYHENSSDLLDIIQLAIAKITGPDNFSETLTSAASRQPCQ